MYTDFRSHVIMYRSYLICLLEVFQPTKRLVRSFDLTFVEMIAFSKYEFS